MGDTYTDFMDLMKRPAVMEMMIDMLLCTVPIWLAVMIGLVIGWSWRPRWTGLVFLGLRSRLRFLLGAAAGLGGARLWFAFTAFSVFSVCRRLWSHFKGKEQVGSASGSGDAGLEGASFRTVSFEREQDIVSEKDLEHLLYLLDGKAGELAWQHQMERTTPNLIYQAWRHEPQVGPTIYRSRTVFEDATPDLVRDFFWDDDFRLKWDPMLAYYKILEDFPQNGTMIVHWIKKFPFFCSDREYIIGRRIWESVNTYFSVTKGVPYPSLPKNEKPRRVELYFSSWRIRAVESRKQDGQLSACEVTFVHYEDMGIPRDVAKVGVRHGMWGTVKKLHSGMRAYQLMRKSEASLSRCAHMAQFTTQVEAGLLDSGSPGNEGEDRGVIREEAHNGLDWKWIVIGGTAAVVCGLHTGLIGKALLFGAARRLSRK